MCVSWLSANTIGWPRKAIAHALQIGFGNSANFVSVNIFIKVEGPGHKTGFTTALVITTIGCVAACVVAFILWKKNKAANEREARGESETNMLGKDEVRFGHTL